MGRRRTGEAGSLDAGIQRIDGALAPAAERHRIEAQAEDGDAVADRLAARLWRGGKNGAAHHAGCLAERIGEVARREDDDPHRLVRRSPRCCRPPRRVRSSGRAAPPRCCAGHTGRSRASCSAPRERTGKRRAFSWYPVRPRISINAGWPVNTCIPSGTCLASSIVHRRFLVAAVVRIRSGAWDQDRPSSGPLLAEAACFACPHGQSGVVTAAPEPCTANCTSQARWR